MHSSLDQENIHLMTNNENVAVINFIQKRVCINNMPQIPRIMQPANAHRGGIILNAPDATSSGEGPTTISLLIVFNR